MGARVIKQRGSSVTRRRREARVLATIIAAVVLPLLLAYFLVAADMRTDLSELRPVHPVPDQATALIGWPDLETSDGRPLRLDEARWHSQQRARMLGYMMDGYTASRDGERVSMFILLPEAGQFLHPAHRVPSQMVEVWLSKPAPFLFRRLVWVTGVLERATGRRDPDRALYALKDSVVDGAADRDIMRWFRL